MRNYNLVPALLLSIFLTVLITDHAGLGQEKLRGFSAASSSREREIEKAFVAIPSPGEERRQHRLFTAEPHLAGSARNNYLAQYVAGQWEAQGLEDVVVREYDVYSTEPVSTSLEMVAPVYYRASHARPPTIGPDTKNPAVSSAWSGMSRSGEVTASVVYAHSGNPEITSYCANKASM